MSSLRCLKNEHSSGHKVANATRPIFWKEEQDNSTKWKGSCVSSLIMVVCAITASGRLIWENVFYLQIDRSRDGENPLNPAKMWSACWTSALDKNVPLSQTGAEQYQQQCGRAAVHEKVQLKKSSHIFIYILYTPSQQVGLICFTQMHLSSRFNRA